MQIILASAETIAEMLGCSHQIAVQNRLGFMQFLDEPSGRAERFDDKPKLPAILAYQLINNPKR